VKKVRGSEIAAKSQTLFETRMCPFESVWTNCVEKKFFGELTWNHLNLDHRYLQQRSLLEDILE
jgi:hypothetical protein